MDSNLNRRDPASEFELVIPIDPQTLGGFISDLLRRPQTIKRRFRGSFDIGKQEIVNVFHLVHQRVLQQNRGSLVQFTVTIAYDDGSTVTVNSLDDFQAYAEVRPQVSKSAHLSWTYLLFFQESVLPEKQVIELSIVSSIAEDLSYEFSESFADHVLNIRRSGFRLHVQHSLRSWGVDIESLLTGHIQSWTLRDHWLKLFISQHPFATGFASAALLFCFFSFGLYQLSARAESDLLILAQSVSSLSVSEKIDWLAQQTVKRTINSRGSLVAVLTMTSLCVSGIFGILMVRLADNPQKSFLVLSEATKAYREKELKKQSKGWAYFVASGITATVAGVASRYIFAAIP